MGGGEEKGPNSLEKKGGGRKGVGKAKRICREGERLLI